MNKCFARYGKVFAVLTLTAMAQVAQASEYYCTVDVTGLEPDGAVIQLDKSGAVAWDKDGAAKRTILSNAAKAAGYKIEVAFRPLKNGKYVHNLIITKRDGGRATIMSDGESLEYTAGPLTVSCGLSQESISK